MRIYAHSSTPTRSSFTAQNLRGKPPMIEQKLRTAHWNVGN